MPSHDRSMDRMQHESHLQPLAVPLDWQGKG